MTSSSEHKEGLRCDRLNTVYSPWSSPTDGYSCCEGLILEDDPELGLGIRCVRKSRLEEGILLKKVKCDKFYPLEVLLSQAVEQELLKPEQLERIRIAVTCPEETRGSEKENPENSEVYPELAEEEQKMATETKDEESRNASRVVLEPPVYPNIQPLDTLNAIVALDAKRQELMEETVRCHFPTFGSGQMRGYAMRVIEYVERERKEGNSQLIFVKVVHVKDGYGVEVTRSAADSFSMGDWSKVSIARDAALKAVSFLNLCNIKTQFVDFDA